MTLPAMLHVVRHGQTDWNKAGRYQGHVDVALNNHGRWQAIRNGMALATHFANIGLSPDESRFVSSPLQRARETAQLIRQACSLRADDVHHDDGFVEAAYGRWEGLTLAQARERFPDDFPRRRADRLRFAPDGGESFAQLTERVMARVSALAAPTVLVCHGGVVKVIFGAYLGLSARQSLSLDIRQDRVFCFRSGKVDYI